MVAAEFSDLRGRVYRDGNNIIIYVYKKGFFETQELTRIIEQYELKNQILQAKLELRIEENPKVPLNKQI